MIDFLYLIYVLLCCFYGDYVIYVVVMKYENNRNNIICMKVEICFSYRLVRYFLNFVYCFKVIYCI